MRPQLYRQLSLRVPAEPFQYVSVAGSTDGDWQHLPPQIDEHTEFATVQAALPGRE